ncbi:MAG: Holliday junction branch migration protein RuvA [Eubacteriales bacterium]
MYYYISGTLALAALSTAVIDAGGVGYRLTISSHTLGKLSGKEGSAVKLYTYFSVREDAMELFGFATEEEKKAFEMLISVSGVGPKAALAILSVLTPERLASAVVSGDAKSIARANGVGAKTAARVVLELKDKIAKVIRPEDGSVLPDPDDAPAGTSALADAQAALMVLGYTRSEAIYALRDADPTLDAESLIREGLKKLMKN